VGQFRGPRSLAMTPNQAQVVVVDEVNRRLVVLDATDGRPVSDLSPPAGVMPCPVGVTIVPHTDQVLVADYTLNQVLLFASIQAAEVVRSFGDGQQGHGDCQLFGPFGVALVAPADVDFDADPAAFAAAAVTAGVDPSLVAIADTYNHRIVLYRLRDASFVRLVGSRGSAHGQFNCPRCIAVVPSAFTPDKHSGWLAVADEGHCRVQVLTQLGQVMRVLQADATNGLSPLSSYLCGLTVCLSTDGQAEILVADSMNRRVVAFAVDGSAARVVCSTGQAHASSGAGEYELTYPTGMVVTAAGDLWVTDRNNHCVCLFR
jgi:hypothetical protein